MRLHCAQRALVPSYLFCMAAYLAMWKQLEPISPGQRSPFKLLVSWPLKPSNLLAFYGFNIHSFQRYMFNIFHLRSILPIRQRDQTCDVAHPKSRMLSVNVFRTKVNKRLYPLSHHISVRYFGNEFCWLSIYLYNPIYIYIPWYIYIYIHTYIHTCMCILLWCMQVTQLGCHHSPIYS